jgi:hypothetical protein
VARGTKAVRAAAVVLSLVAIAGFSACSSSDSGGPANGAGGGGAGSGGLFVSAGGSLGGSSIGQGGGLGAVSGSGAGPSFFPDGSACGTVVQKAEFIELDMYLLIDKSSSMLEQTSAGGTKWTAIERALEAFLNDPGSAGFGVGLQYFPQLKPGVPSVCTTDAQCGASGGPCFLRTCANRDTLTVCTGDSDCDLGEPCVPFGICEFYPQGGSPTYCVPLGSNCALGFGRCLDITDRWCVNGVDCRAEVYAQPDVAIAPLPGSAAPLVTSLRAATPEGRTPTGPALQGAINQAKAWAGTHQGKKVVAVLATDGLPTECTPLEIADVSRIAATGLAGTPSIPTYVIGVFSPQDTESPQNLQAIARAGGTTKAFIVDTSQDVQRQFLAALDAIRGSSRLSCELKLPEESTRGDFDYEKVNLQLAPGMGAATQLVNVGSLARCGTAPGAGWYYDADPKSGQEPTKILVCPDVCQVFSTSAKATVNLQIGCETIVR